MIAGGTIVLKPESRCVAGGEGARFIQLTTPDRPEGADSMTVATLSVSRRTRPTPLSLFNEEHGVNEYTGHNHMLQPTDFRSVEEDYWHLKEHVQIWDVGCERQVEIAGPDAARLVQSMTPRDLRRAAIGKCLYAPLVDEHGGLVNDPIAIKLDHQRYW